jgi:hypothetical protein
MATLGKSKSWNDGQSHQWINITSSSFKNEYLRKLLEIKYNSQKLLNFLDKSLESITGQLKCNFETIFLFLR